MANPVDLDTKPGPWINTPLEDLRSRYKAHEGQPANPATFEGVRPPNENPPLDEVPEIVCRVSVATPDRDLKRIQCNICSTPGKHHGGLLVRSKGYLYVVGPQCARSQYGLDWDNENARFKNVEEERQAIKRLRALLPRISKQDADLKELASQCRDADDIQRQLQRNSKRLKQHIGHADNDGGWLYVIQVRGDSETKERFCRIQGGGWFAGGGGLGNKAKKAVRAIDDLTKGLVGLSLDDQIATLNRAGSVLRTDGGLRRALKSLEECSYSVVKAREFLEKDNLVALQSWLNHDGCPVLGRAVTVRGSFRLHDGRSLESPLDVPVSAFRISPVIRLD